MTTAIEKNSNVRYRARDPFSLARTLFGMDPFLGFETRQARSAFIPPVEVKESTEDYIIKADLPGVKEEDVDISVHGNVLTLSGTRQAEERKEGETYYLYERQYGSFSRSFTLPDEADTESVEANMDNGVLRLRIAKKAESKPRKISLKK